MSTSKQIFFGNDVMEPHRMKIHACVASSGIIPNRTIRGLFVENFLTSKSGNNKV